MRNVILIIGIFLFITSCEKSEQDVKYPECIESQINEFIDNYGVQNPRSSVKKYNYENQIVYVFYKNNISDEQYTVVDEYCNIICAFGSIAGNNTCENWDNAQYIETVWTDNR